MKYSEQDILALLPWYLNNTLSEAERQAVKELLQHSADARTELQLLQDLQQQYRQDEQHRFQGEDFQWRRLQKQLSQYSPSTSQNRAQATTDSDHGHNVTRLQRQTRVARSFAIAATLVIALQSVLLLQTPTSNTDNQFDGQLLSGNTNIEAPQAAIYFRIQIQADTSWQTLMQLLHQYNASIVNGPSAIGLLTLRVPFPEQEALEQAISEQGAEQESSNKNQFQQSVLTTLQQAAFIEHAQVLATE